MAAITLVKRVYAAKATGKYVDARIVKGRNTGTEYYEIHLEQLEEGQAFDRNGEPILLKAGQVAIVNMPLNYAGLEDDVHEGDVVEMAWEQGQLRMAIVEKAGQDGQVPFA